MNDLLERARHRRLLASRALRREAAKKKMTPAEIKQAIEKVQVVQSHFGAPKDAQGNPTGKAGRTIAIIEKWLHEKGEFGLPPMGEAFKAFIRHQLDGANYIWGHDEAAEDVCRDIMYNFHFDPSEIEVVAKTEEEPKPEVQNMTHLPQVVSKIKSFTVKAEAYEMSKAKDSHEAEGVPVVTRVDFEESMEKSKNFDAAKAKCQFPEQPCWNKRNVGVNDLLHDMNATDLEKPAEQLEPIKEDQKARPFTRDNRYPTEKKAALKGFVVKKN